MYKSAALSVLFLTAALAQAPQSAAERAHRHFAGINRQVLEMAEDFPEDKYGFRLTKEMRSFGELIVHIMSGNAYGAKAGMGEKAEWDELDAKNYPNKAAIVAAYKKSVADCEAVLAKYPEGFKKNLEPWMSITEHSAEHYGLLVGYYRVNGMIPPVSRPKPK